MARSATLPRGQIGDIRLMNVTASLFTLIGSAALAAVLLVWLTRLPGFALVAIRIEGDVTRNSVATIRANAMPHLAGNFFTIDLAQARRAFESVPWVRRATVKRVWPNRLAVRLEEHRAAALWLTDTGSDQLVNSYGEVFEANPGDVEDDALPTLHGPDGSSARLLGLWQRLQPLVEPLGDSIETLTLSSRGTLSAELDSGAQIEIGRGSDDELVERVGRFAATLPQVTAQHQRALLSADLRHHDGYAVRLEGVTTTVPPAAGRN